MTKRIVTCFWILHISWNDVFQSQSLCSALISRSLLHSHRPGAVSCPATSIQFRESHDRIRDQNLYTNKINRIPQTPHTAIKRNNNNNLISSSRLHLFRTDDGTRDTTENDNDDDDYDEDGNISDDSIDYVWEVGNVEADFQALEQAINFQNAEFNLQAAERVEMMDNFAKQRRLFLPDLHAFVTRPLRWSLIFVTLQRIIKLRANNNPLASFVARHRLVTLPWDIQFWAMVVVAPILFLQLKKFTMAKPEPMPDDLKGLDSNYLQFVTTDWEDPETSCRDHVLCLAEQWVSAVKGMAWFGLLRLGCFAATHTSVLSHYMRSVPYFPPVTVAILQLLTRIGAMVSLYQFPKLLFQLQREQQPRPKRGDVATLQNLVKTMIRWGMPIGIASDLSQILLPMSRRALVAFCGICVAFLSLMELRYSESRKPGPPSNKPRKRNIWPGRILHATQLILASGALALVMASACTYFVMSSIAKKKMVLPAIPWMLLFSNTALLLVLIRPLCHIRAFARIFSVVHMHDMSLSTNVREVLSNPKEVESRYKWRHRLRWREPERIQAIMEKTRGSWFYWLFIAGSVEDKLEQESIAKLKEKNGAQGVKVWDMVRKDIEYNPFEPAPDRDLWKKDAMTNVAKFHQSDYDKKTFTDPLGVAVQQRLGIGLRFMDDHTRRLKKGEKPSARRLQARAAKSAVARVNNLYRERNKITAGIVENIKDPQERQKQIDQVRETVEEEVAYLAQRLTELIPTEVDPADGPGLKLQNYIPNSTFEVGGQKLKFTLPTDRSNTVEALLRQYASKTGTTATEIHPGSGKSIEAIPLEDEEEFGKDESSNIDDKNDTLQKDANRDEFVESYLKQKFGGKKDDDESDDDDSSIVYV